MCRQVGTQARADAPPELLREDPVDVLFETIDLHPAMPTVQLLSGFRGSGTTTALLRLRDRLEAAEFAAIRVDVRSYLSTDPVDDTPDTVAVPGSALNAVASTLENNRESRTLEPETQGLRRSNRRQPTPTLAPLSYSK